MSTHKERLLNAFQQGFIEPNKAYTQVYLTATVGLLKSDLKKLERKGWALRNYTKNMWLEGEELPDGYVVPKGQRFVGRGHRVLWAMLGAKNG